MKENYIFFSYSRDDSAFVLDLAKKLKESGTDVWLDQLDIPVGARWDSEIEKALDKSNTLLVILSKSSVDSDNVLDEVSFALEENKKVVPVLLEKCEIPFRLRRFQYVDFTGDSNKGFEALSKALAIDDETASKISSISTINKKKETKVNQPSKTESTSKNASFQTTKTTTSVDSMQSRVKKWVFRGLMLLGMVFLVVMFWPMDKLPDSTNTSKVANENATLIAETTVVDPGSQLGVPTQAELESEAWNMALKNNTEEAFYVFKSNFPDSDKSGIADMKISDLKAWNSVKDNDFTSNIEYIINSKPTSGFTEKARANINAMDGSLKKGWIYAGKHDGSLLTSKGFDVICCGDQPVDVIPKKGDIVKNSLTTLFTYADKSQTIGGDANKRYRTGSFSNGTYAIIEDVEILDSSLKYKIKYK